MQDDTETTLGYARPGAEKPHPPMSRLAIAGLLIGLFPMLSAGLGLLMLWAAHGRGIDGLGKELWGLLLVAGGPAIGSFMAPFGLLCALLSLLDITQSRASIRGKGVAIGGVFFNTVALFGILIVRWALHR